MKPAIQQRGAPNPFLSKLFIPEKRMERVCREELEAADLMPDAPREIRIDRFADKRWDITEEYRDIEGDCLGCARFDADGLAAIYIARSLAEDRSAAGERRLRSTLAHEIGHGLFHAELWAEKLKMEATQTRLFEEPNKTDGITKDGFLCRAAIVSGSVSAPPYLWWEVQANKAMSCLLLPWHLVTTAAQARLEEVRSQADDKAQKRAIAAAERELAELFNVNPVMVEYRLKKWWKEELSTVRLL